MMWMVVLVVRTFSVGAEQENPRVLPPTVHQSEEDENITLSWDVSTRTDMSHINIVCFLDSEPPKMLYHMIRGAEDPESQDQQFAGRVHLDRDALREGRVRLHLSRVSAGDSGHYRCDLAANYDGDARRWELEDTETFVLNVKQTLEEEDEDVSVSKPDPGPAAGGSTPPQRGQCEAEYVFLTLLMGAQALTVVAALVKMLRDVRKHGGVSADDGRSNARRQVTVDIPDDTHPG